MYAVALLALAASDGDPAPSPAVAPVVAPSAAPEASPVAPPPAAGADAVPRATLDPVDAGKSVPFSLLIGVTPEATTLLRRSPPRRTS